MFGYSAMMQEDETLAMTLLERHKSFIRISVEKHEGTDI